MNRLFAPVALLCIAAAPMAFANTVITGTVTSSGDPFTITTDDLTDTITADMGAHLGIALLTGGVWSDGVLAGSNPSASVFFTANASGADGFFQQGATRYELDVTHVTGAIPEPSAWAMMLLGFAGIGGAMRLSYSRSTSRAETDEDPGFQPAPP